MSTARSYSTTFAKSIVFDPQTQDHAMYLDGEIIGFARTEAEAQTTLDQLIRELLSTSPMSLTAFPALTIDQVAEALGVLAAHDADPGIFAEALAHLAAGVTITADDADHLIDGMRVHRAPLGDSWPWPWRCTCGQARCWHGALLEGVLLAWEQLGDDGRPLPFEIAA